MVFNNVLIKKVGEARGTSQTTGDDWKKKLILLEFEDEFGKSYINASADCAEWDSLGYKEGEVVSLNLKFRTKAFMSGFVTNEIRIKTPQNA